MYLLQVTSVNGSYKNYKTMSNTYYDAKLSELSYYFALQIKFAASAKSIKFDSAKCQRFLEHFNFGKDGADFSVKPGSENLQLSEVLGVYVSVLRKIDGRTKLVKNLKWFDLFRLFY